MHYVYDLPPMYARDRTALQAAAPSIVFVHVTWCRYCKQARPLMEQLGKALGSTVPVYALDADQRPDLAKSLNVKSYPTILYVNHKGVRQFEGERSFDALVGFVCDNSADTALAQGVCQRRKK